MTSKAQKLRKHRDWQKKRGRPRNEDAARTDSGQISRARNPGEAPDLLGRRKRVEMYGSFLNETEKASLLASAGLQEMGTVIGRLKKSREISEAQHRALQRFGELAERYRSVMMVPDSLKRRDGGGVMTIADSDSEIETVDKWKKVTGIIQQANISHAGNLMAALQYTVVRDEFHEHLLGDTRIAANVLVRYYGIS